MNSLTAGFTHEDSIARYAQERMPLLAKGSPPAKSAGGEGSALFAGPDVAASPGVNGTRLCARAFGLHSAKALHERAIGQVPWRSPKCPRPGRGRMQMVFFSLHGGFFLLVLHLLREAGQFFANRPQGLDRHVTGSNPRGQSQGQSYDLNKGGEIEEFPEALRGYRNPIPSQKS